jgi:hypothetical protein
MQDATLTWLLCQEGYHIFLSDTLNGTLPVVNAEFNRQLKGKGEQTLVQLYFLSPIARISSGENSCVIKSSEA